MDGVSLLIVIASFITALIAVNRTSQLQKAVTRLAGEIEALRRTGVPAEAAAPPQPVPAIDPTARSSTAWETAAGREPASAAETPVQVPAAEPAAPPRDVEGALAGRWFVWIGGVAIAIGGLLFVKYAYDSGLIAPSLQVILGLAAGLFLVFSGSWLRRRGGAGAAGYVSAALAAAGLAVVFAAVYAAQALYGLVSPGTAFAGLAATGVFGLLLSRQQGPLVAALGLIGSYATPMLIPSVEPSAWRFFPYLLVILVASFLALRGRNWWWLGHAAVIGMFLWSMLWITGPFQPGDVWPVGLSAIAMGLVAMFTLGGTAVLRGGGLPPPRGIGLVGQAAAVMVLVLLVVHAGHTPEALGLLAAGLAVMLLIAWAGPALSWLAPVAGAVMLAALATWQEAAFHAMTLDEHGLWTWSSSPGPEAQRFLDWMLRSGAALGLIGAAGVVFRRGRWGFGALGGGAALLFLLGAWARVDYMLAPEAWAQLAAGAAMVLLLATALWSRRAGEGEWGAGLLAAGAAALLVVALDRMLDGVWLTLAIAGLALALAILTPLLRPRLMGPVIAALATLTALRLFVSRELWLDQRSLPWGQHWPLYGYGVPAVLFIIASRMLRRTGHPRAAVALEGISLGLLISLASLEIRALIAGGFGSEAPQFLEMAAHVLTWAGAAYGLMHRQGLYSSVLSLWGARALLLAAALGAVVLSLGTLNPVLTGEPVEGGPVVNALLLAYLAPVPLIWLIARRLHVVGWEALKPVAGGLALVLLFAYVTLETKRLFQGPLLAVEAQSLAENYAYSTVWLGFALFLFVAGIRMASKAVRFAGLGVLALVVLKVFASDLSSLEGLYRIASFVALGLCLVGIGWLYQRFVSDRPRPAAA